MQPYPKLTRERLAALPNGTHLKLGGLLVKLTGRGQFIRGDGSTEDVIEYVDASGTAGSFTESVFLMRPQSILMPPAAFIAANGAIRATA